MTYGAYVLAGVCVLIEVVRAVRELQRRRLARYRAERDAEEDAIQQMHDRQLDAHQDSIDAMCEAMEAKARRVPRGLPADAPGRLATFDDLMRWYFERDEHERWAPATGHSDVAAALRGAAYELEELARAGAALLRAEARRWTSAEGTLSHAELRAMLGDHAARVHRTVTGVVAYLWYADLQAQPRNGSLEKRAEVAALVEQLADSAIGCRSWFLAYGDVEGEGDLQMLMTHVDEVVRLTGGCRPSTWLACRDEDLHREAVYATERACADVSTALQRLQERLREASPGEPARRSS